MGYSRTLPLICGDFSVQKQDFCTISRGNPENPPFLRCVLVFRNSFSLNEGTHDHLSGIRRNGWTLIGLTNLADALHLFGQSGVLMRDRSGIAERFVIYLITIFL